MVEFVKKTRSSGKHLYFTMKTLRVFSQSKGIDLKFMSFSRCIQGKSCSASKSTIIHNNNISTALFLANLQSAVIMSGIDQHGEC